MVLPGQHPEGGKMSDTLSRQVLSREEFRKHIMDECRRAGFYETAKRMDLDHMMLSRIIALETPIDDDTARKFGFEPETLAITVYRRTT